MTHMSRVQAALAEYRESAGSGVRDYGSDGGYERLAVRLKDARDENRRLFLVAIAMLIVLFTAIVIISTIKVDQLAGATQGVISGVFGISAAGAVRMMFGKWQEMSKADYVLILLPELRELAPDRFVAIITKLLDDWYS